jgi:hypothetical protein
MIDYMKSTTKTNKTPTKSTNSAPTSPVANGSDNNNQMLALASVILAFFIAPLGLVLGIIAYRKSKAAGINNGLALGGIIASTIMIILGSVIIASVLPSAKRMNDYCEKAGRGQQYQEDGLAITCE